MPRPTTVTYRVYSTPAEVAAAAAQLFTSSVIAAANARGIARVAISGGTTPKAMFALLADPCAAVCEAGAMGQAGSVLGG